MSDFIIPEKIYKKFKDGKTINTYETYRKMLGKLFKELFNENTYSLKKLKENKDKVDKYLKKLSITSRKLISIAIVMILKASEAEKSLIDYYGVLAREYRIDDKKMRKDRDATEDEMAWHITWEWILLMKKDYKHFLDTVSINDLTDLAYKRIYMGWVIFDLITSLPPQRGECLFNCYVNRDVKGSNIIDLNKKVWIIRESKTKKSYGQRELPLNDKTIHNIREWMKISNCKDKLLICNDQGRKMSTQSYTQFLNCTLFKTGACRHISTDDLRKAYVTYMITHVGIEDEERLKMARDLGHSVSTMMSSYFKPDLETNILL